MTEQKQPEPEPDTRTPFERFADLAKRVVTVPKEVADERRKSA